MFDNLAARLRDSDTSYRLVIPLLASTLLVQAVTSLTRVTISYALSNCTCPSSGSA